MNEVSKEIKLVSLKNNSNNLFASKCLKKNDQTCDDCLIQLCTYIIPNVSNNVQIPKSMSFIKLTVHFI